MVFVIEYYDPKDDKHYTGRAENKEAAEQFKLVLEHLGTKEVTVFEEPDPTTVTVTVTLFRSDARDLNYWVLRKLDHDCYSESSKDQFERIHEALLKGIHKKEIHKEDKPQMSPRLEVYVKILEQLKTNETGLKLEYENEFGKESIWCKEIRTGFERELEYIQDSIKDIQRLISFFE
jgi:hypothetical protein